MARNGTRATGIQVRLSEKVKTEFQEIAEGYGMAMSALAAYVIGQWVHNQKQVLSPLINRMGDDAAQAFQKVFHEEGFQKAFEAMMQGSGTVEDK